MSDPKDGGFSRAERSSATAGSADTRSHAKEKAEKAVMDWLMLDKPETAQVTNEKFRALHQRIAAALEEAREPSAEERDVIEAAKRLEESGGLRTWSNENECHDCTRTYEFVVRHGKGHAPDCTIKAFRDAVTALDATEKNRVR